MFDRAWIRRDRGMIKFILSYKGQEVMGSYDRSYPEGILHIE